MGDCAKRTLRDRTGIAHGFFKFIFNLGLTQKPGFWTRNIGFGQKIDNEKPGFFRLMRKSYNPYRQKNLKIIKLIEVY